MKEWKKTIRKLGRGLMKEKSNLVILALCLITFVIGIMTIGFGKTLLVLLALGVVIAIPIIISSQTKKKKKRINETKSASGAIIHDSNIEVEEPIDFGDDPEKDEIIIDKDEKKEAKPVAKTKGKKKDKKKMSKKKKVLIVLLSIFIIGLICMFLGFLFIAATAPKFDPDNLYHKESTIVYGTDDTVIGKLGRENREKVSYDDLPQVLVDAIVATEDSRFFQHNGFDLPRFVKATLGHAAGASGAGGASTLSMQVIKNNYTSTDTTLKRKFTDIYLSIFKLEQKYSKEEIMEFYVNVPYLGSGSYGVEEASKTYFGKSVKDLNLAEASVIAGLFQAPGAYDPYIYPEKAEQRRKTVLNLMVRHGYITQKEADAANSIPVKDLLKGKGQNSDKYQGYLDTVVEEVIKKTGDNPYDVPMKIYTSMNKEKQEYLEKILSGELWNFENDVVQTGIAVTDINTGAVVAVGAGRNRDGERSFNYATMINRQPGSTAKPIFDFGPGMEFNNMSTYTPFMDEPYNYSDGTPIRDWDRKYMGFMTLRESLAQSRNIPALKAFQSVDNKKIISFVEGLGITPEISGGKIHEAHAIGGFNGTSPLQLAAAYGAFGNGGYYIEPYTVNKIEYRGDDKNNGKTKEFKHEKKRAMSDSTAFMITDVLKTAVQSGLSKGAAVDGVNVAGKTGTTDFDEETKKRKNLPDDAINDFWVVSYSPDYAIGMWYGYKEISNQHYNNGVSGGAIRDKLFKTISKGIMDKNGKDFKKPDSVVAVEVEMGSNPAKLASDATPANKRITEYFKKGTEPTETSNTYNVPDNVSNLNARLNESTKVVSLSWNAVSAPKGYNEEENGAIGYAIYVTMNGNTTKLDYTTGTSFTHNIGNHTGDITYTVKTAYSNNQSVESKGTSTTVKVKVEESTINITLAGQASMTLNSGATFTDPGVKVTEDGKDVTTEAKVSTTVSGAGTAVNTSVPGTYTITYKVTYQNTTKTLTRTVTVLSAGGPDSGGESGNPTT